MTRAAVFAGAVLRHLHVVGGTDYECRVWTVNHGRPQQELALVLREGDRGELEL
jgi:hypothetical protein